MNELENLPANSHTAKEANLPAKTKPIAQGTKVDTGGGGGIFKRMIKHFFAMSAKEMAYHLLEDVVEPSAKNVLSDLVTSAKDLLLFGSTASVPTVTKGTDYNALSNSTAVTVSKKDKALHNFQNVKLPSRKAAIDILMAMRAQLETYKEVTVGYFYDVAGVESDFTDYTFGWKHLNGADVKQLSDGWILQLPPVRKLSE